MALYPEQVTHAAQRVLQAVQKSFAEQGVALPDRQFLYAGPQPTADFDTQDSEHPGFLAVGVGPLTAGPPGATSNTATSAPVMAALTRRSVQLRVWLFRAVHTITVQGDLPTPDDLTADAVQSFTDLAVLVGALEDARRDLAVVGTNVAFAVDPITPVTTLGGYSGQTATIDVDLLDGTR